MKIINLNSPQEVDSVISWLNQRGRPVVLDIETTGLSRFEDKLIEYQFKGVDDDEVYIAPANTAGCLESLRCLIVAHNAKFDLGFLFRQGVDLLSKPFRCTLLMGALLQEDRESNSLDSWVEQIWGDSYKTRFWGKYDSYASAPKDEAQEYAAKDVYYTGLLYTYLDTSLAKDNIPNTLIEHVHRLQTVLLKTELTGVEVDLDYLAQVGGELQGRLGAIIPQMRSQVKDQIDLVELRLWEVEMQKRKTEKGKEKVLRPEFSFDSTKQLQSLLYDVMELPAQRNAKTKAPSTDEDSLEKLREKHPIIPMLLDYRGLTKVYGTYISGTLEKVRNGRIYPEFNVCGTVTGRITHSNPNLAQLPKSGGVRGIYKPAPGCCMISADYSQLEVVIEANLTQDANLIKMIQEGISKHDLTARELGVDRSVAKTLNFALQYRASHFKVAQLLGVSEWEAQSIWNKYWEIYAGCRSLQLQTDRQIDRGEPVINLFGRKRRFEARKRQPWDKEYRQAYNFLIQSTGADFTSEASYLMSEFLESRKYGRVLFTVHDEILIEVQEQHSAECDKKLVEIMCGLGEKYGLKIPLKAESSGPMERWLD